MSLFTSAQGPQNTFSTAVMAAKCFSALALSTTAVAQPADDDFFPYEWHIAEKSGANIYVSSTIETKSSLAKQVLDEHMASKNYKAASDKVLLTRVANKQKGIPVTFVDNSSKDFIFSLANR